MRLISLTTYKAARGATRIMYLPMLFSFLFVCYLFYCGCKYIVLILKIKIYARFFFDDNSDCMKKTVGL